MHIAMQFLQKVEIPFSQLLLMLQRHHKPIGLIGGINGCLTNSFCRVTLQILVDVGHLVHSNNGTTHENRLHHHHRTSKEITGIGIEGIHQTVAQSIEISSHAL